MKNRMVKGLLLTSLIAFSFMMNHSLARDLQVYKHPKQNIQFEASAGWKENPYHKDKGIYEIFDPDKDIHVMLWLTTTEQKAPRYLEKMADMKGLVLEGKPAKIQIKNHDVWLYNAPGLINKKSVQILLAVIPHGKSKEYPRENVLHIIQIWCPEEQFADNEQSMTLILNSVQITE
ncbi:MAG: hypothetical protein GTO16_03275 [Candidatus Aminicenantes bacterium]|nr:hypothetical protein [Candidatus Aminicenantes bacterium]